jgi:transposase
MPHCNTDTFQIYLDEFSKQSMDEFKIIMLDNGAFHKGQNLIIPKNIALLFIPPYSPELNPAEKIWQKIKRAFSGRIYETLDHVSEFITQQVNQLTNEQVKSICGYDYIFSSLN